TSETKPRIIGRDQAYYTTTHYDDFGRVRSVTQDLGFVGDANVFMRDTTTTFYLGLAVASSHPVAGQGEVRTECRSVRGKTRAVTPSIAGTIQYVYDAEGNLTQSQLPGGSVVNITYDQRGRKKTTQDPDLGTWTYEYECFGDLPAQPDNKGQRTRMEYDGLGRMVTRIDATGG